MRNERGMVLVIVMLLLISMTVIGFLSIATTTTNINVEGNKRLGKENMHASESVLEISGPFIKETVFEGAVPPSFTDPDLIINADVVTEILAMHQPDPEDTTDNAFDASPDIRLPNAVTGITLTGDIDYLYATTAVGSAIEFASGYEGVGQGLGQAGALIYYKINAVARGPVLSATRLGSLYRYVTQ